VYFLHLRLKLNIRFAVSDQSISKTLQTQFVSDLTFKQWLNGERAILDGKLFSLQTLTPRKELILLILKFKPGFVRRELTPRMSTTGIGKQIINSTCFY